MMLTIWRNLPGTKAIHTWKPGVVSIKTLAAMAVLGSGTKPFLSRQASTRHFTGTCPSLVWRPQPITFPPSDVVKPHAVVSVDRTNRQLPRQCCLQNQSRTPTLLREIIELFSFGKRVTARWVDFFSQYLVCYSQRLFWVSPF